METYDKQKIQTLSDAYMKEQGKRINMLSQTGQNLIVEIKSMRENSRKPTPQIDQIRANLQAGKYSCLSDIFKWDLAGIPAKYIPEEFRRDFLYIIDRFTNFQYPSNMYRRSLRCKNPEPHLTKVLLTISNFNLMGFYHCSIVSYLKGEMDPDLAAARLSLSYNTEMYEDIIAAELDLGNPLLEETLRDIILSDQNTNVVSRGMIRGIIKSGNTEMHKLLGDFLLAARLQEGIRQSICENMDCGTTAAFLLLFDVIEHNQLDRFAAVKRALATWTGICDMEHLDRINGKQIKLISECLHSKEARTLYLQSNDSIELYIAVWSFGFYCVEDALPLIESIIENGTRNQKLTLSYYVRNLSYEMFSNRISKKVIEAYPDDYEILACYFPSYLGGHVSAIYKATKPLDSGRFTDRVPVYPNFISTSEAISHFDLLMLIYSGMPKKLSFSPCIFPWYSVEIEKSDCITRICFIAGILGMQEYTNIACALIPEISCSGYGSRKNYVSLLLSHPQSNTQINMLIKMLSDKESSSSQAAFEIAKGVDFSSGAYQEIEKLFAYKSSSVRSNVSAILNRQDDVNLYSSIERLLQSKDEGLRTGGLDLLIQLSKNKQREALYKQSKNLALGISAPSSKEQILIDEICGKSQTAKIVSTAGFGLYNPDTPLNLPAVPIDPTILKKTFYPANSVGFFKSLLAGKVQPLSQKLYGILYKLDHLIEQNKNLEYTRGHFSEPCLLGNSINFISYDWTVPQLERLPFPELWQKFYTDEIHDFITLLQLTIGWKATDRSDVFKYFENELTAIFGQEILGVRSTGLTYTKHFRTILDALLEQYDNDSVSFSVSKAVVDHIIRQTPSRNLTYSYQSKWGRQGVINFPSYDLISQFVTDLSSSKSDREFTDSFVLLYLLNERYKFQAGTYGANYYSSRNSTIGNMTIFSFIRAESLGIITKDHVYKALFEQLEMPGELVSLAQTVRDDLRPADQNFLKQVSLCKDLDTSSPEAMALQSSLIASAQKYYLQAIELMLSVELKRGDSETIFSTKILSIKRIYGAHFLVPILLALGNDTLNRSQMNYFSSEKKVSKKDSLSHLLKVCYPLHSDNSDTLRQLLSNTDITEQRMIETAMYVPQWIDIIGEYLGFEGFRSGCYYFMAHMNEHFDNDLTARIAKFTPLTTEELNNGAFDIHWFQEAYTLLGEKRFNMLYNSAKYISSGSRHSRAQKFADAVTGKFNLSETANEISAKRNKDLLISYTLIPLTNKDSDLLSRYQFLQNFLKESRQFGAQRRASESKAVEIALSNLAQNAGYSDVIRLTLSMETRLISENHAYFEETPIDNVTVAIQISEGGASEIICRKNGKILSSVPAAAKKEEFYAELSTFNSQLKQQYSRTRLMLEQAMEDKTFFFVSELTALEGNPVIYPLIRNLIFTCDNTAFMPKTGNLKSGIMTDWKGLCVSLPSDTKVRVAHPYDLYQEGCWYEYQKQLFDSKLVQPFKQVFRELYVKTEDEQDVYHSLRYAGNQIQPQKTVACLKGRRWIADYEDGLQKVFYKENLAARIFAMADWFSPSDIEAPTLEWVEFSDRKSGKPVMLSAIPDIIFSEVMRDVDLAVSIAHAGGVDPETSHSTIEMRSAIVAFSMPLFKLANVTVEKNFAVIKGSRAEYSVHLGSGIIHQLGGTQISVLPVHSQSRGRLFLPFLDADPKTAEIMSKIILFAEDNKIKDPSILDQIMMR